MDSRPGASDLSRVLGKLGRTVPIKALSSWIPPRWVNVYDYVFPSVEEIYTILKHEMAWTAPESGAEHMDCLLHGIPFYIHTLKFAQLTSTTLHHSHLIRLGRMDRQEALRIENKKLENPEVPSMLDPFLEEIDMTRDEFASYVRDWRRVYKYRMGS